MTNVSTPCSNSPPPWPRLGFQKTYRVQPRKISVETFPNRVESARTESKSAPDPCHLCSSVVRFRFFPDHPITCDHRITRSMGPHYHSAATLQKKGAPHFKGAPPFRESITRRSDQLRVRPRALRGTSFRRWTRAAPWRLCRRERSPVHALRLQRSAPACG